MKPFAALAAVCTLGCAAIPATAAEPLPSDEPLPVADLDWMSGAWIQEGETVVQEAWSRPSFGAMAGVGVTTGLNREAKIEVMTITTVNARPVYTAYVDGQPATTFRLKRGDPGVAVFENLDHDFPQRVIYRKCGEDLCARIEGTLDGKLQGMDWRYKRVR